MDATERGRASIVEAFVRNAERAPENLCLRFEGEEISYRRLRERAEVFGSALAAWGLRPGERVALFLGNHPDLLAAYVGTHLTGGVVVPVNTQYRKGELGHILGDAGVRLCLTDGERRPELDGAREALPELETVIETGPELEDFLGGGGTLQREMPRRDDLAVIAYTSGTTGRSKGAMLLHSNLVANARVVDVKTREPLPGGDTGEIEVRGPNVFPGYWNRPDATGESFDEEGWFATGDLGSVGEDGYFTISGRAKELIISGGYNVYPREVEETIEGCPGVSEVAAVVSEDPDLTAERVMGFCRDDLAGYKKPRQVVFVEKLPRNALGKVLKHRVREELNEPEE
ncbi:hypothetical protein BH18ACT11_BH18ACT11_01060 [soil metagenome]